VAVERRDDAHVVRAPGVALVLVLAAGGAHAPAEPLIEPGWVAPSYGVKQPAPVVSVAVEGVAAATFTTLVVPLAPGAPIPTMSARTSEDGTTVVEVSGERFTDTLTWSDDGCPLDLGPLKCRASAGWVRRDADGATRVRAAGVGGGPVWAGWDAGRGMSAGREGEL